MSIKNHIKPLLIFFISLFFYGIAFSEVGTDRIYSQLTLKKKAHLENSLSEYKSKINELSLNLFNIDDKLNWLNMKIAKINDEKREVPENLLTTIKDLELQKQVTVNELNRFKKAHLDMQKELQNLANQVETESGGTLPAWWPLTPQEKLEFEKKKKEKLELEKQKLALQKQNKTPEELDIDEKKNKFETYLKDLKKDKNKSNLEQWLNVESDFKKNEILLTNKLPILFADDGVNLPKNYEKVIQDIALFVKKQNLIKIEVIGYTNAPSKKTKKDKETEESFIVGTKRAASVASIFVKSGISNSLVKVLSGGKIDMSKKGNLSEAVFARKVDIIIYLKIEK